jgi:hypothetical protein
VDNKALFIVDKSYQLAMQACCCIKHIMFPLYAGSRYVNSKYFLQRYNYYFDT